MGLFFYKRLVWIRKVLTITEHCSSKNLPSFAINPGTKWLRSRFIFYIKTCCQDFRRREMETLNCCCCCCCFSEIPVLWSLIQKQDCSCHLFLWNVNSLLVPFCSASLPCPDQVGGEMQNFVPNILIFLWWKAACRELKRDQFLNTVFKRWFSDTGWKSCPCFPT